MYERVSHSGDVEPPIEIWSERLESEIASGRCVHLRRIAVLRETESTQDAARRMTGDTPGLVVIAHRQSAGRGRLGRTWTDPRGHGVAVTFALDARRFDAPFLSIAAGLAACRTVEDSLATTGTRVGLRWPNDVVQRGSDGSPARKIAGVLVEASGNLALVGVGINVCQRDADWPDELRTKAVSVRDLGSSDTRLDVIARLIVRLDAHLGVDPAELARAWTRRDALVGTRQSFVHDGVSYLGLVESIDPTSAVRLRTDTGIVSLPALTTSLVKD